MANCLRNLKRPSEAAEERRQCWNIECRNNSPADSVSLERAFALAEDLIASKRYIEARTVIDISTKAVAETSDESEEQKEWIDRLKNLSIKEK